MTERHNNRRRAGLLIAAASALGLSARAQLPRRKFAVLSLFGNELQVVTRRAVTGSNIARPDTVSLPIAGGVFDRAALAVAERVLLPLQAPTPEVVLLTSASPSLHQNQERYIVDGRARLPEPFVQAMKQDGATHLVLLTRHRGEARLRVREAWLGEGLVEGPGFYVDRAEILKNIDTREVRVGFVAAFAYLRARLIDLGSMQLLAERQLQGSRTVVRSTGDGSTDVWEALDGAQKVSLLNAVVAQELERELPGLVGRP